MNIDLSSPERLLLLDALRHPAYKEKIKEPKTKHVIRQTYRLLIEKLEEDEVTSRKVRETISNGKLIVPGREN